MKEKTFQSPISNYELKALLRPDLVNLKPYSSARDEFTGSEGIFLDANENPNDTDVNRYPDPYQRKLKARISEIQNVAVENIFLGNGSDEIIDLLFRAFCVPGKDKVTSIKPSYGMYSVSAAINNVELNEVPLSMEIRDTKYEENFVPRTSNFVLNTKSLLSGAIDSKLIFLCSPNNPTGNAFPKEQILEVVKNFNGIVVVDEAYVDFQEEESMITEVNNYPNLFVCQTFSKAYGMAGLRLGKGFASKEIVAILNGIKPPYNINALTQAYALNALKDMDKINTQIAELNSERKRVFEAMLKSDQIIEVYPSEANFILFKVKDATSTYNKLVEKGIVIRNRTTQYACENCLRVSIGTKEENDNFLAELEKN